MKRKGLIIILCITSLALAGIIITQLFWMHNALQLRQEQFNHKVKFILKSTINELMEINRDTETDTPNKNCRSICEMDDKNIFEVIRPATLDSIIRYEINYFNVNTEYEYGIFYCDKDSLIMGKSDHYRNELFRTRHTANLSCFWKNSCFKLGIYFPNQKSYLISKMGWWLVLSIAFMLILVIGFFFTIYLMIRQKKLADMKNDFVNNMTHEFKTPISTISITSELLMKDNVNRNPEKVERYAAVIYDENSRLRSQVERVLQMAVLDKGELKMKQALINVHDIIVEVVDAFSIPVSERKGTITTSLNAQNVEMFADPMHFRNVISNLIDNALKYSKEIPEIKITTESVNDRILISVIDKGIGISAEHQKCIFKKFFRVPTGNIHDVKGFGLGLFYVKTIVDLHNGNVNLKSELKKGTTFILDFPIKK
ncbi:MAG: HAMP domain-containing sensor histidine kinase [Bacteroidota bacterium]